MKTSLEIGMIANRLATTLVVDKEFREVCRESAILLRQMEMYAQRIETLAHSVEDKSAMIDELNTEINMMHELIKSLKE